MNNPNSPLINKINSIEKEIAWLARFIDGEGYIGITFQRKKETRQLKYLLNLIQPYLRLKQKQCELLLNFIDIRKKAKRITGRGYRGATSYTIEENIYQKLLSLINVVYKYA